jgi:hypothetical protein
MCRACFCSTDVVALEPASLIHRGAQPRNGENVSPTVGTRESSPDVVRVQFRNPVVCLPGRCDQGFVSSSSDCGHLMALWK